MFQGSPRAIGHTPFTLSSLIHLSSSSCNQTVENYTFKINESATANHATKRMFLPNLSLQLSLYYAVAIFKLLTHLIQTLGTFNPPGRVEAWGHNKQT